MSTPLLWLIAGSILCLMEFIFPTAFVAFMMGIGALLVAVVGFLVPHLSLQVALWKKPSTWMVFSTSLVILSRRFFTPNRSRRAGIRDYKEGETLTAIAPGKTGRVLYEGNSWRAQCDLEYEGIAPHEKVYILREEGTTLIVFPAKILESSNY